MTYRPAIESAEASVLERVRVSVAEARRAAWVVEVVLLGEACVTCVHGCMCMGMCYMCYMGVCVWACVTCVLACVSACVCAWHVYAHGHVYVHGHVCTDLLEGSRAVDAI